MSDLDVEITTPINGLDDLCHLGFAHAEQKRWKGKLDDYKARFYELADDEIRALGLAEQVVEIAADDSDQAVERAERWHPGWIADEWRAHSTEPRYWEVIIIEDPSLKKFSHTVDGKTYTRQIAKGSPFVDDEWLSLCDLDLYNEVTVELPWGDRVIYPLDRLDPKQVAALAPYIFYGKPRVSLTVKDAKPED